MKVSIVDLKNKAASVEERLQEHNIPCKVLMNFAYGMFSYEIKWGLTVQNLERQYVTDFGTKKECWQALDKAFYAIIYAWSQEKKEGN